MLDFPRCLGILCRIRQKIDRTSLRESGPINSYCDTWIANDRKASVAQIALAWLLHQQAVTSVIIGAKRLEQLEDNIAATGIKLSGGELAALDKAGALPPEYPGWMFDFQGQGRRTQLAASENA